MAIPPIAAVEIGTTKTTVLIGEYDDAAGKIHVVGAGTSQTAGVRKGQVFDLEQAQYCIATAVKAATEESHIAVEEVFLAVSGGHIMAEPAEGHTLVESKDQLVSEEDLDEVESIIERKKLPDDRQLLHTLTQYYCVGDLRGVQNPRGLKGATLEQHALRIHAKSDLLQNSVNAVKNTGRVEVADCAFSGMGAAFAVLTPAQKKNGVALIDFGGGTVDYMVYADDTLITAGTLGVGGDHISNDIAQAFNIGQTVAEEIKKEHGCALIHMEDATRRIALPKEVGGAERTISARALQTVIEARVAETLRFIWEIIEKTGAMPSLGEGIILTGGGAYLRNLTKATSQVFHLPCEIGLPTNVVWHREMPNPAAFAVPAGLLKFGLEHYQTTQPISGIGRLIRGVFGR